MQLDKDEVGLILSALEWDRVGTYGDGREERINALVAKIKRLEGLELALAYLKKEARANA
jgi:hypothetical protein